jgi:hypothetical protein
MGPLSKRGIAIKPPKKISQPFGPSPEKIGQKPHGPSFWIFNPGVYKCYYFTY